MAGVPTCRQVSETAVCFHSSRPVMAVTNSQGLALQLRACSWQSLGYIRNYQEPGMMQAQATRLRLHQPLQAGLRA